jgi:hypothetical protein
LCYARIKLKAIPETGTAFRNVDKCNKTFVNKP